MINDCIDFQILGDKARCIITYQGKKRILASSYIKPVFTVLHKNNYPYKEILVNGVETLRYYDVNKKLFKELLTNSRDIKRKVKRNNKYVNKKLVTDSLLSILLLLSTIVRLKQLLMKPLVIF